jgi:hypothetical protein
VVYLDLGAGLDRCVIFRSAASCVSAARFSLSYSDMLAGQSRTRVGRSGLLPSDFDDVAFFVYRFSFGIGFAGLKLNRLVANGTDREPHLGREAHSLYVGTIPLIVRLIVRRCRYASAQMDFG